MDVNLHGACMGKLVGPAGGGGGGAGGGGISTQFRILPNSLPSECCPADAEKVPVNSHRVALQLRVSATTQPHRTFSPEPLKISDEYLSSGSNSPSLDATTGFLLRDRSPAGQLPPITHLSPISFQSEEFKEIESAMRGKGATQSQPHETESLLVIS